VLANQTLYISGQIGLDAKSGTIVEGGVVAEAEQVIVPFINGSCLNPCLNMIASKYVHYF